MEFPHYFPELENRSFWLGEGPFFMRQSRFAWCLSPMKRGRTMREAACWEQSWSAHNDLEALPCINSKPFLYHFRILMEKGHWRWLCRLMSTNERSVWMESEGLEILRTQHQNRILSVLRGAFLESKGGMKYLEIPMGNLRISRVMLKYLKFLIPGLLYSDSLFRF